MLKTWLMSRAACRMQANRMNESEEIKPAYLHVIEHECNIASVKSNKTITYVIDMHLWPFIYLLNNA